MKVGETNGSDGANVDANAITKSNKRALAALIDAAELFADDESRRRGFEAAAAFHGIQLNTAPVARTDGHLPAGADGSKSTSPPAEGDGELALSRQAKAWVAQHGLDESLFVPIFHRGDDGVQVIAHTVPGRSTKERVQSCYLLTGVKALIATGQPKFSDEEARALCKDLGCFDLANHSTYVKAMGNMLTGGKSQGHELTQVGRKAAAETIREMNNAQ